jgi:hypothetical protein
MLLPLAAIAGGYRWVYFRELRIVTAALNSTPDVKVLSAWGNEDLTLEDIWADIEVHGSHKVILFALEKSSFESGGDFCLARIDNYAIRYKAYGDFVWGADGLRKGSSLSNRICFGAENEFAPLVPVKIDKVQDLIGSVEEIKGVLAGWPRCPGFLEFESTKARYRLCTTQDVAVGEYPPDFGAR